MTHVKNFIYFHVLKQRVFIGSGLFFGRFPKRNNVIFYDIYFGLWQFCSRKLRLRQFVYRTLHPGLFIHRTLHPSVFVHRTLHRGPFVHRTLHPGPFVYRIPHPGPFVHRILHPRPFWYKSDDPNEHFGAHKMFIRCIIKMNFRPHSFCLLTFKLLSVCR